MLIFSKQIFEVDFKIEGTSIEGKYQYYTQTDNFVGYEYNTEVELNSDIKVESDITTTILDSDDIENIIDEMDIDYATDEIIIISKQDIADYIGADTIKSIEVQE